MFKKRILINIFSNWTSFLILLVIRFLLTPFLIYRLGDEEYGIWILLISVVDYMELMNLGLNTSIIRYISKFVEIKDYKKENEIFNTALFMFLLLALLVMIAVLSIAIFVPNFYAFSGKYIYKIIFIIVGFNLAFEFIFHTFSATLSAKQKFLEISIVGTSSFLIRTGLVVIALLMGYKLLSIAIIQVCTNLIRGIILSLYSMKTSPEIEINFRAVKRDAFRNIFSYSFYNLLIKISAKINLTGSILIIGYFLSAGAVTFYSIAMSLISYLNTLIYEMQKVLIPRFSQLDAQNKNEKFQEHFLAFTRYTLIIAIPIIYVFIFYGDSFIKLWIGEKYAILSGQILAILAIGKIFHISQLTIESALKAIDKHKNLSFLKMAESISVLILSIFLVRKYGLTGIAYANAFPVIFFNLLVIPIYACTLLKISIVKYYLKYIFKNIFAILPLFLIFHSINYPINTYPVFGLSVISIAIVSFILSFVLILDSKERKLVYSLFRMGR